MPRFFSCFLTLFCLFSFHLQAQNDGTPDVTFNQTGYWVKDFGFHDNLTTLLVQSDGKIVYTGTALSPAFQGSLIVGRLNSDGTTDESFGEGGIFTYDSNGETYGYALHELPDGSLLIGGVQISLNTGYGDILLIKLNPDGSLEHNFGDGGSIVHSFTDYDDFLQAMAVQADGKIVVSGTVSDVSGFDIFNTPAILRFTADGDVDTGFGTAGVTRFPAVAIDNELTSCKILSDGKIVAAGHYQNVFTGATDFDILVVKVDENGTPDADFGTSGQVITPVYGGIDDAFGMDVDPEGRIVVGGFATAPVTLTFDMVLMRYLANGELDDSFGGDGFVIYDNTPYDVCNDLIIHPDGKIIAVGGTGEFLAPKKFAVWRYLSDGTPDTEFGIDGLATLEVFPESGHEFNGVALQSDGKIVAAGKALDQNNEAVVARFDIRTSATYNAVNKAPAEWLFPNPSNGEVHFRLDPSIDWDQSVIRILDMHGKLSAEIPVRQAATDAHLALEPGMFSYQIQNSGRMFVGRLVILR